MFAREEDVIANLDTLGITKLGGGGQSNSTRVERNYSKKLISLVKSKKGEEAIPYSLTVLEPFKLKQEMA